MIVFENKGKLDIRAIKIMGISSKDDKSSAIGYFGTGLKYALAILLRHGATVSVVTGSQSYEFGILPTKIRHDNFDIVTMNGEELGFTTELGKDWELWMAFREIYSNMLDENGRAYETGVFTPEEGNTYVTVNYDPFAKIFNDRNKYFLNSNREPIAVSRNVEIYEKAPDDQLESSIYFKGVRVLVSKQEGMYNYNLLSGLTLTEDRTVRDGWSLAWELAHAVVMLKDKALIRRLVTAGRGSYEQFMNFRHADSSASMATFFLDVVGELRKQLMDVGMNQTAIDFHKEHTKTPTILPGISCHMTNIEQQQLDRAYSFCKDALGLELDDFRLIVAKDLGNGHLGRANIEDGIMYISKQCFREGTKRVAVALLEEYTHCKHRVEDETLEQKWVYLNQILSLGEQLKGEPL